MASSTRPWSREGVPPQWLWSGEEDTVDGGLEGIIGKAWA